MPAPEACVIAVGGGEYVVLIGKFRILQHDGINIGKESHHVRVTAPVLASADIAKITRAIEAIQATQDGKKKAAKQF